MLPKVSVVIPTLNAVGVLGACLKSIRSQNYPADRLEIVIGDGGSTDGTLELAKKYGAKVVINKLKTAEAGKMVGLKATMGEYIALIDSDNILPDANWLNEMITPLLEHPEAVGSEPWKYTWRREDGFITRYCALIGMNDPLVHFLGNYDRINLLTGKWTEVPHEEKDLGEYLLVKFDKRGLPTIGANGTVFRADYLKHTISGDYLFDIDILAETINREGSISFLKVKNGIIHTYCESSIFKFARKQRRRVKDFLYYKWVLKDRKYDWYGKDIFGKDPWGIIKFTLCCILIVPLFIQVVRGYLKKPDQAWFFHPLACYITLWEYGWGRIGVLSGHEFDRKDWKQ